VGVFEWLRRILSRPSAETLAGHDPDNTRLIVGLGNPGPEYAETRHNVGFRAVNEIARRFNVSWQDKSDSLGSKVAVLHPTDKQTVILAKPQTFMNRSGRAVNNLLQFLGLESQSALVVYDEMDLPFGTLRLRERGSPGTHNGMRSVVSSLKTEDVPRLRIGIGQSSPGEATNHVLSEFAPEDQHEVEELIQRAAEGALAWAEHGPVVAMNRYNKT